MPCSHPGPSPCPHPTTGDKVLCLWHDPAVAKVDAYVREVFIAADRAGQGAFAGAALAGIDLSQLRLGGRDFSGADLRDARFDHADLSGTNLAGADLHRASFHRANLRGANLAGADLTGTSLVGADLRGADLSRAVLDGTVLLGADLRDANLDGAKVQSFQWNRLTRFQGMRGLDPQTSGSDTTQVFLAPAAFGDLPTVARGALVADPTQLATHTFSLRNRSPLDALEPDTSPISTSALQQPFPTADSETATVPLGPKPRLRWPGVVLSGLAGLALVAGGWVAGSRLGGSPVATVPPVVVQGTDPQVLDGLKAQHEADLGELRKLQDKLRTQGIELVEAKETAVQAQAARERVERTRQDLLADLARLTDAADRAAVAEVRAGEWTALAKDLARTSAKQDRVARILADGVERTTTENHDLTTRLAEASAKAHLLETTQAENVRLVRETQAMRQERDQLQTLYQTASTDLAQSKRAIERYLGRIAGTQLEGLLTDADGDAPFLAIAPGRPLSLGGDYLVSLQVDPAPTPGALSVRMVVQRPAAAANPDATVVLYDAQKRPLRRLAASFPHVDAGAPFVTLNSTISCDRQPAFARILLGPGAEEVAAR